MSDVKLTKVRIKEGVWIGELTLGDGDQPKIEARHFDQVLDGLEVKADPQDQNRFAIRIPIPAELLTEGVQTIVITDANTGAKLESFSIVTGQPVDDDIRAEINLLREELDMLKRAFRRHCVETM